MVSVYTTSCNIKNLLILPKECVYVCRKFFPYVAEIVSLCSTCRMGIQIEAAFVLWGVRTGCFYMIYKNVTLLIQRDNYIRDMKLSRRFWVEHDAEFICIFCGIFGSVCHLHILGVQLSWNGEGELCQALVTNCKILGVITPNTNLRFIITWTVSLVLKT